MLWQAKLSLTIDNTDERFEDVDLTDARISTKIGLLVEDSFEYVTKGIFYLNSCPGFRRHHSN